MSKALIDALTDQLHVPHVLTISRGRMVTTLGPWSNGHDEQAAIVTHVTGSGISGDLVNLFIFVDLGQPVVVQGVPWFPTRRDADQALAANPEQANIIGGAVCCYFPERTS